MAGETFTPTEVHYDVKSMERVVSATFAYGPNSFNNPYFSIYFIVNHAGIVAVYDKSTPVPGSVMNENNEMPFLDQLRTNTLPLKQGSNKYEVLSFIRGELERIGQKLKTESRVLSDSDIGKLMTKIASKYEGQPNQ